MDDATKGTKAEPSGEQQQSKKENHSLGSLLQGYTKLETASILIEAENEGVDVLAIIQKLNLPVNPSLPTIRKMKKIADIAIVKSSLATLMNHIKANVATNWHDSYLLEDGEVGKFLDKMERVLKNASTLVLVHHTFHEQALQICKVLIQAIRHMDTLGSVVSVWDMCADQGFTGKVWDLWFHALQDGRNCGIFNDDDLRKEEENAGKVNTFEEQHTEAVCKEKLEEFAKNPTYTAYNRIVRSLKPPNSQLQKEVADRMVTFLESKASLPDTTEWKSHLLSILFLRQDLEKVVSVGKKWFPESTQSFVGPLDFDLLDQMKRIACSVLDIEVQWVWELCSKILLGLAKEIPRYSEKIYDEEVSDWKLLHSSTFNPEANRVRWQGGNKSAQRYSSEVSTQLWKWLKVAYCCVSSETNWEVITEIRYDSNRVKSHDIVRAPVVNQGIHLDQWLRLTNEIEAIIKENSSPEILEAARRGPQAHHFWEDSTEVKMLLYPLKCVGGENDSWNRYLEKIQWREKNPDNSVSKDLRKFLRNFAKFEEHQEYY